MCGPEQRTFLLPATECAMPIPLWRTTDPGFADALAGLVRKLSLDEGLQAAGRRAPEPPEQAVSAILADVRDRGDAALVEYVRRFDGCRLAPDQLRVEPGQIEAAVARCPEAHLAALRLAASRIRRFQEHILLRNPQPLCEGGRTLGLRYTPVDSAGIYIPGAAASLASSVLMTAVPAAVAGVGRIVMATPARPDGTVADDRLVAAHVAGVAEVYKLGGAYAVAAMAYGTASVPRVDFIVGPGNIYAILAKKQVFGTVGIEMLPGPSEVVIIADSAADAGCVAADLISQAEHNPGSAILLTDSADLAGGVGREIEGQLTGFPGAAETAACLRDYGAVVLCRSLDECVEIANRLAPEHMEVLTGDPASVAAKVRHAAAVFLGPWAPVATGDYIAGPSHVLPTSGTARFSSGLCANDFLKRTSLIAYEEVALKADADAITRMARAEGLEGHARSVERRVE